MSNLSPLNSEHFEFGNSQSVTSSLSPLSRWISKSYPQDFSFVVISSSPALIDKTSGLVIPNQFVQFVTSELMDIQIPSPVYKNSLSIMSITPLNRWTTIYPWLTLSCPYYLWIGLIKFILMECYLHSQLFWELTLAECYLHQLFQDLMQLNFYKILNYDTII